MIFRFIKYALMSLIFPIISFAAVPEWQIIPKESNITFTAVQNNAPVSGQFKTFSGDIAYDPNQLALSHVKITIDMGSVSDAYNQLSDTLKAKEWFDVPQFPNAIFIADKFVKTGDKTYQANGMLTIRDKTTPVTLTFTQEDYSATHALMKGSTTIKRTAFGVGQGEWADTKTIKDDVKIDFTIGASKK